MRNFGNKKPQMAQIKGALATDIGFFMSEILKYSSIWVTFHPIKGITFSIFEIFVSQNVWHISKDICVGCIGMTYYITNFKKDMFEIYLYG